MRWREETKVNCSVFSFLYLLSLPTQQDCVLPVYALSKNYVDPTWERSANYSARTFFLFLLSRRGEITTTNRLGGNS